MIMDTFFQQIKFEKRILSCRKGGFLYPKKNLLKYHEFEILLIQRNKLERK